MLKNINIEQRLKLFLKTFLFHKVFYVTLHHQKNVKKSMKGNREDNNREEVKLKIIETALNEYRSRGIKDVKMDDIASLISVSKRTIYELFTDKEVLITETLKHHHKLMHDEAREIIKQCENILDVILCLYELYFN